MARRRRKIHKSPPEIRPELPRGTMTIERIAYGGDGVGSLDGRVVFVPQTAPGDVVDVQLVSQRRRYAVGTVTALRQPSSWRVPAPCPLYERCGGCHMQHLAYTHQLATKTAQVQRCLQRIGKLTDVVVTPMLESPLPFAYRNKVIYHYDSQRGALGLIGRQEQQIIDVPRCLISDPRADAIMAQIRALAATQPALRYALHQVQVQVGQRTAEVLVTVIVHAPLPDAVQQLLWEHLRDLATGVVMHHKAHDTPAVFDGTTTSIAGASCIHERIGTQRFRIEPQAFFQVNTVQMERLYALVQEAAALHGHEVVLDLYSGGGTIALTLAPQCGCVYAVDNNRQAMLLAQQQSLACGITNCQFRTGKVERILYRYLAQGLRLTLLSSTRHGPGVVRKPYRPWR